MNEVVHILQFPKIQDLRGNLTFIEHQKYCPFEIKRVFLTYDVPGGAIRGGHSFYKQKEIIIALSGSFDVVVTDKNSENFSYSMNRSYYGIYLPALTWRQLSNFSTNAVVLHLSNEPYNEEDYIRNFGNYKRL